MISLFSLSSKSFGVIESLICEDLAKVECYLNDFVVY